MTRLVRPTDNKMKKPIRVKIISMGDVEVGKSCIIKRFCERRFVNKYMTTIGIDYGVTRVKVEDADLKINIFDMSGDPMFYEVRNEFYNDTQGVLLVYDVSNRKSFDRLVVWMNEIKSELPAKELSNVVFSLCANKIDKKRTVDEGIGRLWADANGMAYWETSAQSGQNVNEMFQSLFEDIVRTLENGGIRTTNTQLGYTKEQSEAIQRLKVAKSDYDRLGINPNATKDEINRAYRKLAVLLHPDKSVAPGSEEAFKILVTARTNLLQATS